MGKINVAIIGVGNCASSYFMKSPPIQYTDDVAKGKVQQFIEGRLEW